MVSSATFPDYFLKDGPGVVSPQELNTELDLTIFAECFARPLGINRCYMGTEPLDMITAAYNRQMKEILPSYGIEVVEIPRLENAGGVLSASRVRRLLDKGNLAAIGELVPHDIRIPYGKPERRTG
jgi:[citrate (pro-3S)-lyase] ligase